MENNTSTLPFNKDEYQLADETTFDTGYTPTPTFDKSQYEMATPETFNPYQPAPKPDYTPTSPQEAAIDVKSGFLDKLYSGLKTVFPSAAAFGEQSGLALRNIKDYYIDGVPANQLGEASSWGKTLPAMAGVGLDIGSAATAIPTGGLSLLPRAGIKAAEGGLTSGGSVFLGEKAQGATTEEALKSSITPAIVGGVVGGTIGAIPGAKKAVDATLDNPKIKAIVGQIVQGDIADQSIAAKALANTKLNNVKTYSDLSGAIDTRLKTLKEGVDVIMGNDTTKRTLSELDKVVKVGDLQENVNFVRKALDNLYEAYDTIGLTEDKLRIKNLLLMAEKEGLTTKQINDIAREYGSEFGKKAFGKTGEALTSVNARAFENTRKGVKEAARNLLPDESSKTLDKEMSNLLDTKVLVEKMEEKVNALTQKVQPRSILQKIGRAIGTPIGIAADATGIKSLFMKVFLESDQGFKTLNSLALQDELPKRIKQFESLLSGNEEGITNAIISQLRKMNKTDVINILSGKAVAPSQEE